MGTMCGGSNGVGRRKCGGSIAAGITDGGFLAAKCGGNLSHATLTGGLGDMTGGGGDDDGGRGEG